MADSPPALDAATLAGLRAQLEQERERVRALLPRDPGERDAALRGADSADALATEPEDFGEMGYELTEEATNNALADGNRRHLAQVERALLRMDDGSYGISEISGAPIPLERLQALPWATTTVDDPNQETQPDTEPTY